MNDKERINEVIRYSKMSVKRFCESLGLNRADRIYHIQKGRNNISAAMAKLITQHYPDISYNWLLTGDGPMLKSGRQNEVVMINFDNVMMVPLVNQYAYGGYMSGYANDTYLENLPKIPFVVDHEYKGNYLSFEVKGDSMDDGSKNSLEAGDILLGREIRRDLWQCKLHINKWNAFIIAHRNEGIVVKQIVDHDVENGTITCHSYNPLFPDFTLNLSEVIKLYNVVKVIKSI